MSLSTLFTAKDNSSLDIAKISGALTVLSFVALSIYAVVAKGQTWDPTAFGVGAGAVIAAMGAALGF